MDQQARRVIQLRLERETLTERIRELARKGAVSFSDHAFDRMDERGISDVQVQRVLQSGEIRGDIEPGRNAGEWKCKVVDQVKGMREIGVATLIIRNAKLFIKTVEWEDPQ
jgi:hypothetical protein